MIIHLKATYSATGLDGAGNPSASYVGYGFDTESDTIVGVSGTWRGAALENKPADIYVPDGNIFWNTCGETDTPTQYTATLYHHVRPTGSGYGSFTTSTEANSLYCNYVPPANPAAGTFIRDECRDANGQVGGFNRYRITANGQGGETATLTQANSPLCGYNPPVDPSPVRGCMDPEASNYNAAATQDDGSCVYDPRLVPSTLPHLAALGLPLLFTLQSAATGQVPAAARLLLTVGMLTEGAVLTINGESFTAVTTNPAPGEFSSGITLATALASSVTLTARYRVSQPAPDQVQLVALASGSQLTPVVSFRVPAPNPDPGFTVNLTPGVDELRSQTKAEWGCYVEIWAIPGAVWGQPDNDLSQIYLVERLEQLYQASNRYVFDLAPALLPLVGHSRQTSTDRLVAYFVRYGEVYVPANEQVRQRLVVADTGGRWGLESAVPVPALAGSLVLSVPCPGGVLPTDRATYAERLYVLAPAGAAVQVQRRTLSYAGVPSTQVLNRVAGGGVETIELSSLLTPLVDASLRTTLTVSVAGAALGSYVLEHKPAAAYLVFLSRRGAYETVWFRGVEEPAPKRQAQLYAKGRNQAVARVNLTLARRLTSGLLTRAGLDWLCEELASSPVVLLFHPVTGQEEPVVLTSFSPDYNAPENRYTLTCDVEPAAPFAVLTA
ncbi:hypothetical protein [uncultured Hymenobacter sp.]|uniref:hypothetical protein n=1 Tax=uncultured Hymenobacter sp. TaxID=170016 RepID=UPI0035CB2653